MLVNDFKMSSGSNDDQFISSENDELSSLPFSSNCDEDWANNNHRPLSIKEETDVIERLRRENLNLRLELYFKEKDNSVNLKKSFSINNLNRSRDDIKNENNLTEKKLKYYITSLERKENEIILLKNHYESIIKNKNYELELLKTEKELESKENIESNFIILQELINEKDNEIKILNESNQLLKKDLEQKSKLLEQSSVISKDDINQEDELKLKKISSRIEVLESLLKKKNAEINYLKTNCEKCKLNEKEIQMFKKESIELKKFETCKLSLEETRKELDHFKIKLKNQKIIEKDKLDNYAKLLLEKETEIEELKDKFASINKAKNISNKPSDSNEIISVYKKMVLEKDEEIDFLKDYVRNNKIEDLNEHIKTLEEKFSLQEELIKKMKTDFLKKLKAKDDLVEKNNYEKQHLLNTLESYKEKKRNYEKLISKQLQKTNLILKTAKTNFAEKQG